MLRRILASVVFVALAAGQARAGHLALNFAGVTTAGSSYPDGTAIPTGTSFDVQALFSSTPFQSAPNLGLYAVSSVTATVNGTAYSDILPGLYFVALAGPNAAPGFNYVTELVNSVSEFSPTYSTATNSFNGSAAAPTVFSGYSGTPGPPGLENILTLSLPLNQNLTLLYDPTAGVSASVSAVPEPASHIMLLLGLSGAGIALVRRRRAAAMA
jgi:PEP-CTERM motif